MDCSGLPPALRKRMEAQAKKAQEAKEAKAKGIKPAAKKPVLRRPKPKPKPAPPPADMEPCEDMSQAVPTAGRGLASSPPGGAQRSPPRFEECMDAPPPGRGLAMSPPGGMMSQPVDECMDAPPPGRGLANTPPRAEECMDAPPPGRGLAMTPPGQYDECRDAPPPGRGLASTPPGQYDECTGAPPPGRGLAMSPPQGRQDQCMDAPPQGRGLASSPPMGASVQARRSPSPQRRGPLEELMGQYRPPPMPTGDFDMDYFDPWAPECQPAPQAPPMTFRGGGGDEVGDILGGFDDECFDRPQPTGSPIPFDMEEMCQPEPSQYSPQVREDLLVPIAQAHDVMPYGPAHRGREDIDVGNLVDYDTMIENAADQVAAAADMVIEAAKQSAALAASEAAANAEAQAREVMREQAQQAEQARAQAQAQAQAGGGGGLARTPPMPRRVPTPRVATPPRIPTPPRVPTPSPVRQPSPQRTPPRGPARSPFGSPCGWEQDVLWSEMSPGARTRHAMDFQPPALHHPILPCQGQEAPGDIPFYDPRMLTSTVTVQVDPQRARDYYYEADPDDLIACEPYGPPQAPPLPGGNIWETDFSRVDWGERYKTDPYQFDPCGHWAPPAKPRMTRSPFSPNRPSPRGSARPGSPMLRPVSPMFARTGRTPPPVDLCGSPEAVPLPPSPQMEAQQLVEAAGSPECRPAAVSPPIRGQQGGFSVPEYAPSRSPPIRAQQGGFSVPEFAPPKSPPISASRGGFSVPEYAEGPCSPPISASRGGFNVPEFADGPRSPPISAMRGGFNVPEFAEEPCAPRSPPISAMRGGFNVPEFAEEPCAPRSPPISSMRGGFNVPEFADGQRSPPISSMRGGFNVPEFADGPMTPRPRTPSPCRVKTPPNESLAGFLSRKMPNVMESFMGPVPPRAPPKRRMNFDSSCAQYTPAPPDYSNIGSVNAPMEYDFGGMGEASPEQLCAPRPSDYMSPQMRSPPISTRSPPISAQRGGFNVPEFAEGPCSPPISSMRGGFSVPEFAPGPRSPPISSMKGGFNVPEFAEGPCSPPISSMRGGFNVPEFAGGPTSPPISAMRGGFNVPEFAGGPCAVPGTPAPVRSPGRAPTPCRPSPSEMSMMDWAMSTMPSTADPLAGFPRPPRSPMQLSPPSRPSPCRPDRPPSRRPDYSRLGLGGENAPMEYDWSLPHPGAEYDISPEQSCEPRPSDYRSPHVSPTPCSPPPQRVSPQFQRSPPISSMRGQFNVSEFPDEPCGARSPPISSMRGGFNVSEFPEEPCAPRSPPISAMRGGFNVSEFPEEPCGSRSPPISAMRGGFNVPEFPEEPCGSRSPPISAMRGGFNVPEFPDEPCGSRSPPISAMRGGFNVPEFPDEPCTPRSPPISSMRGGFNVSEYPDDAYGSPEQLCAGRPSGYMSPPLTPEQTCDVRPSDYTSPPGNLYDWAMSAMPSMADFFCKWYVTLVVHMMAHLATLTILIVYEMIYS